MKDVKKYFVKVIKIKYLYIYIFLYINLEHSLNKTACHECGNKLNRII